MRGSGETNEISGMQLTKTDRINALNDTHSASTNHATQTQRAEAQLTVLSHNLVCRPLLY